MRQDLAELLPWWLWLLDVPPGARTSITSAVGARGGHQLRGCRVFAGVFAGSYPLAHPPGVGARLHPLLLQTTPPAPNGRSWREKVIFLSAPLACLAEPSATVGGAEPCRSPPEAAFCTNLTPKQAEKSRQHPRPGAFSKTGPFLHLALSAHVKSHTHNCYFPGCFYLYYFYYYYY